jgi:N4-gp56 family major capsid protein
MNALNTMASLPLQQKVLDDRRLLMRSLPLLAYKRVQKKVTHPQHEGSGHRFRRFESLGINTTPLSEGVPPLAVALTQSSVTATLQQMGNCIRITDRLSTEGIDQVKLEAIDVLAENMAQTLDAAARAEAVLGTAVRYTGGRTSRATVAKADILTLNDLLRGVNQLRRNNAPAYTGVRSSETGVGGHYFGVIHPDVGLDLFNDNRVQNVVSYQDKNKLWSFTLPELGGVLLIQSTNAPIFAGAGAAGADVYGTILFGKEGFFGIDPSWMKILASGDAVSTTELIIKDFGSSGIADPLNQISSLAWKCTNADKLVDNTRVVRIESGASFV